MTDFLEQVVASRRAYVRDARHLRPEDTLLEALAPNAWPGKARASWRGLFPVRDAFTASLIDRRSAGKIAVIAELKRVSPAIGRVVADVDVERQTMVYETAGAAAISVLTEPRHWGGSLDDLRTARSATDLPILCKDVIVDEYQIVEARAAGADAVLLIAEVLSDEELKRFATRAASLSMGVLVEAHEAVAFGRAVECGAPVVGVNARNLRRPEELDIGRVRQLHTFAKQGQILVAESGIKNAQDARLLPARVDAILVGTALMRAEDPDPMLRELATISRPPRASVELRPGTRIEVRRR